MVKLPLENDKQKTFIELFEAQVRETPNNTAVSFQSDSLTYEQLNLAANQLARRIQKDYQYCQQKSVGNEKFVGLFLEQSIDIVVSILATLKAGFCYVPISPEFPDARINHILNETNAFVILTHTVHHDRIKKLSAKTRLSTVVAVEHFNNDSEFGGHNLSNTNFLNDLSYVIYTSGTSGKPKGVMIENGTFIYFINEAIRWISREPISTLSLTNYTFDIFGLEYGVSLLTGGHLHLSKIDSLHTDIKTHRASINFIQQTPSMWQLFYLGDYEEIDCQHIQVMIGGESSPQGLLSKLSKTFKRVSHVYGPTETCIWSTVDDCSFEDEGVIGLPFNGEEVFVLSDNLKMLPVGEIGELYIGGKGLARGYLNQPKLTSEKFINNPFQANSSLSSRLYRTGDKVKRLPNNRLQYCGRIDSQVKIRGFRVELSEIESILNAHKDVIQSVVAVKENESQRVLVGYVVLRKGQTFQKDVLFKSLFKYLPDYMVPSDLMVIPTIPVNSNGKVDRNQLPEPSFQASENYIAPQNDIEKTLCFIWQEVLNLNQVGVTDNFFRLGGTSIAAVHLTALSRQYLQKDIPLSALFKFKTIEKLAKNLSSINLTTIPCRQQNKYELSFAQSRLYFFEQLEQGSYLYHMPLLTKLKSNTDFKVIKQSLAIMVERHSILRTLYQYDKDNLLSQCVEQQDFVVKESCESNSEALLNAIETQITTPFDLAIEFSLRANIFECQDEFILLLVFHHISFDGWSIDLFMKELSHIYHALCEGQEVSLPKNDIQYGDFAVWQKSYLSGERKLKMQSYWREQLKDFELLALPTDKPRPKMFEFDGELFRFEIDESLSNELRLIAKDHETTLYSVLLSAFYLTLSSLSGQNDLVVGTSADNRNHAQTQTILGFFVNLLALRVKVDSSESVAELINNVHVMISDARVNQELPFDQVVDILDVDRDQSRHPLFQILFLVQDFFDDLSHYDGLPFEPMHFDDDQQKKKIEQLQHSAKFDLTFVLDDKNPSISGAIIYAKSLFESESIDSLASSFLEVLRSFSESVRQPISRVNTVSAEELARTKVRYEALNNTHRNYDEPKSLMEKVFSKDNIRNDNVAVSFKETQYSYKELDTLSNQIANLLIQRDLSKNELVGVFVERGINFVAGILGVLKCGAAYVPIDPSYPPERIESILGQSKVKTIITQRSLVHSLSEYKCSTLRLLLCVDENIWEDQPSDLKKNLELSSIEIQDSRSIKLADKSKPNTPYEPNDTAYVIFTSGSTGEPKGVQVTLDNMYNVALTADIFGVSSTSRVLQFAPLCFDISIGEIFPALSVGGQVHILPAEDRNSPQLFIDTIEKLGITLITTTPSYFYHIIALAKDNRQALSSIKTVIIGGEALLLSQVKKWRALFEDNNQLFNVYGPTETTVLSSYYHVDDDVDSSREVIVLGKPIFNTQIYVLDENNRICPPNKNGEIVIGGNGVTRGYLNNKEKTDEVFVENISTDLEPRRYYRSGDMGRLLPDGNLEFLGRIDNQVKISGFRIELDEVQKALNELPEIKQAVVVDLERNGEKYLAAYFEKEDGIEINIDHLFDQLHIKLPAYMVPASMTQLDEIPLTINSKLDRKALPEPSLLTTTEYVAPRNELEVKLCEIWKELLALDSVGINDNFFRIGGNSILAIRLSAECRRVLNRDLPLALLFSEKTISAISDKLNRQSMVVITRSNTERQVLSFAQERLLFIERFESGVDAYHIPKLVKLIEGTDLVCLERAINRTLKKHPVLKTRYLIDEHGEDYPFVSKEDVVIEHRQMDSFSACLKDVKSEAKIPFDLENELSIRLVHYKLVGADYFLIIFHHIAIDGWSTDLFMGDLAKFYQMEMEGNFLDEEDKGISYTDYAAWQKSYLKDEVLSQLVAYWKNQLSGFELLQVPLDYPRPKHFQFNGANFNFSLNEDVSKKVRELAISNETTVYTVLLSAFFVTLSKLTGQDDIVLGTASDNRHHVQTQSLVGFFVNTLALRSQVNSSLSIKETIANTHHVVSQAMVHQDLPFETLLDELKVERDVSRHPIYQVMFLVQDINENFSKYKGIPFEGLTNELTRNAIDDAHCPAKFDLTVLLNDSNTIIDGVINYATALFSESSIVRMQQMYNQVLKEFTDNSDKSVNDIEALSQVDRQELSNHYQVLNATSRQNNQFNGLLDKIFDKRRKNYNSTAVAYENENYTYSALNKRSNQIAQTLLSSGVKKGDLVGVFLKRSIEFVPTIIGVLKSGAAYVPIDDNHPPERIQSILSQCHFDVVITQYELCETLISLSNGELDTVINVDEFPEPFKNEENNALYIKDLSTRIIDNTTIHNMCDRAVQQLIDKNDIAYVIFTSGSTGEPKGVKVSHGNLFNMTLIAELFNWNPSEIILQFAPLCFDVSVGEIFPILTIGGQVRILPNDKRNSPQLYLETVCKYSVTTMSMTPSYFYQLVDIACDHLEQLASVKTVVLGGEAVLQSQVNKWRALFGNQIRIINAYGPTETTVLSSYHVIDSDADKHREMVVMGKPISNTQIHIVDKKHDLCQVNQSGEVVISGEGVTMGYLNDQEKTDKVFIKNTNPFITAKVFYKTGDIGRLLPTGQLEYLGRVDNQVKIRGFRVELGEITSVLSEQLGIKQAVVISRNKGDNAYLAAYIVLQVADELIVDVDELRKSILKRLPSYMCPSTFTVIPSIPLTINGKLDEKCLPEPVFSSSRQYLAPNTETERQLVSIWGEILSSNQDEIGILDDFFHSGGHSLLAVKLVSEIKKVCHVEISVKDIFEQSTIRSLANFMDSMISTSIEWATNAITPIKSDEPLIASFQQQRLWFLNELNHGSAEYNMSIAFKVSGNFNIKTAEFAIGEIIKRHSILRTNYESKSGKVFQVIREVAPFTIQHHDLRQQSNEDQFLSIDNIVALETSRHFDLKSDLLLRVTFIECVPTNFSTRKTSKNPLKDDHHANVLVMNMHHICTDGWSMELFLEEFKTYYESNLNGNDIQLDDNNLSYSDYAAWQVKEFNNERYKSSMNYWIEQLSNLPTKHELPLNFKRVSNRNKHGKSVHQLIDKTLLNELQQLANSNHMTLFMLLHACLSMVFSRHSGSDDIVIGTPIANRLQPELERMIGMFVNTLVLRLNTLHNSLGDYFSHVKSVHFDAQAHQEVPFEQLVERCNITRDISHTPMFQIMLSMAPKETCLNLKGAALSPMTKTMKAVKFDLDISIDQLDDSLGVNWLYDQSLFKHDSVKNLSVHFETMLRSFVTTFKMTRGDLSKTSLAKIKMLTKQEEKVLAKGINYQVINFPQRGVIQEAFESHVAQSPNALAVTENEQCFTYSEINERANQLARFIREDLDKDEGGSLTPNPFICLYMDRSVEMLVAILAVLKAGCAYVPLSPQHPSSRTHFILKDTCSKFILTHSKELESLRERTADYSEPVNIVNITELKDLKEKSTSNLSIGCIDTDLAYVIYTSGTTGQPKGVMIEHRNVLNYANVLNSQINARFNRVDFSSNYCFDLSVTTSLCPFILGKSIHIYSGDLLSIEDYRRHLVENKVGFVKTTPSHAKALLLETQTHIPTLMLGGEKLSDHLILDLSTYTDFIYDEYGPTEATVGAMLSLVYPGKNKGIGNAYPNTKLYNLSKSGTFVPQGSPGELFIGGAGLARGYLNQLELTQDKFIANPYATTKEKELGWDRLYKTGDMVRYLECGNWEYLGRNDNQIKIRGFRIELEEIEKAINQYPSVKQSVVTFQEEKMPQTIHAYIVMHENETFDKNGLQGFLNNSLPTYMIPNGFIEISKIPLTHNGKIDTGRLLSPVMVSDDKHHSAPHTPIEKTIFEVWCDLLSLKDDQLGVHSNFFDLGGHSLIIGTMIRKINDNLMTSLQVQDVFHHQTIHQLAQHARKSLLNSASQKINGVDIIVLKEGDKKAPPMFFIHPVEGSSYCYIELSQSLNHKGTIYGIQCNQLFDSIEHMSASYKATIYSIQSEGSFSLAGWSMGGTVAYEVARSLKEDGHDIFEVIMIDSFAPALLRELAKYEALEANAPSRQLNILNATVSSLKLKLNSTEKEMLLDKLNIGMNLFLESILNFANKQFGIGDHYSLEELKKQFEKVSHNTSILNNYYPKKSLSNLHLIRSSENMNENDYLGWEHFSSVVSKSVSSGDHFSLFDQVNIEELASKINNRLALNCNTAVPGRLEENA